MFTFLAQSVQVHSYLGGIVTTTTTKAQYVLVLEKLYENKKHKNASFSLRAFSRYLGLAETVLSDIFRGNRHLPKNNAKEIVEKLELSPKEAQQFLSSVEAEHLSINALSKEKPKIQAFLTLELSDLNYEVIAHNIHYTFLSLLDLDIFENDPEWMSQKLKITKEELSKVLQNLERAGLIQINDNKITKTYKDLETPQDVSSKAIKASHEETLEKAKLALHEFDVELRYFASQTMCLNLNKIEHAKKLMREFRLKLAELMESSGEQEAKKEEVFMLAMQFYPLTNITHQK